MTLRFLREQSGRSQDEIAKVMGAYGHSWQQTTVAKTEAARRPLRVNELVDLARILNVSPGDLIDTSIRMSDAGLRFFAAIARRDTARKRVESASAELAEREAYLAEVEAELEEAQAALDQENSKADGEH